jgi:hypothetical protein
MKDKVLAVVPIFVILVVTVGIIFGVNYATNFGPGQKYAPGGSEAVSLNNDTDENSTPDETTSGSSDGSTTELPVGEDGSVNIDPNSATGGAPTDSGDVQIPSEDAPADGSDSSK